MIGRCWRPVWKWEDCPVVGPRPLEDFSTKYLNLPSLIFISMHRLCIQQPLTGRSPGVLYLWPGSTCTGGDVRWWRPCLTSPGAEPLKNRFLERSAVQQNKQYWWIWAGEATCYLSNSVLIPPIWCLSMKTTWWFFFKGPSTWTVFIEGWLCVYIYRGPGAVAGRFV